MFITTMRVGGHHYSYYMNSEPFIQCVSSLITTTLLYNFLSRYCLKNLALHFMFSWFSFTMSSWSLRNLLLDLETLTEQGMFFSCLVFCSMLLAEVAAYTVGEPRGLSMNILFVFVAEPILFKTVKFSMKKMFKPKKKPL